MTDPKTFKPVRIFSSAAGGDLMRWVQENLEKGNTVLLIDLQEVLFMDSTGLAMLVMAHKAVKQVGGTLALVNLNGQARMLFDMSGMNDFFEVYSTPAAFSALCA
jgi:anti-anti-sigma factor